MTPLFIHRPSRFARGLIALMIGLSAAVFDLTSPGTAVEERLGLDLLFWLRGEEQPPAEVVVVSIDHESAVALGAADEPEAWPRHLHAELIRRFQDAGAALIVFNVFFGAPQAPGDAAMAQVMREAGNVVLTDYLKLRHYGGGIYVESLAEPVSTLAEAALATAPFLLPQTAHARGFLTRYGDRDTLPVTLLYLYVVRAAVDELIELVGSVDPPLAVFFQQRRDDLRKSQGLRLFLHEWARRIEGRPDLKAALAERLREAEVSAAVLSALGLLLDTSRPDGQLHFNHYGPDGTIPRVSYHELIDASSSPRISLAGKVVLVGFSRDFQPESTEGLFYSPFSPVSSVELAATAFANALENTTVRPLFDTSGRFFWLLCWGSLLGLIGQSARLWLGIAGIVILTLAYVGIASALFGSENIWVPVVLPLVWQAPAVFSVALWRSYLQRTKERHRMASVMQRFIPVDVVSRLVGRPEQEGLDDVGRLTFGVCVASDAGQYTALAETLEPMALTALMNAYYGALFPAVTQNHGWVSDVVGDAMMAIWTGPGDALEIKRRGLKAALGMHRAAVEFERAHAVRLPLRIGIHSGDMRVGLVGASDHNEFRATGDTVNTAARLEALNKLLGTGILASAAVVAHQAEFVTRPLGSFVLAGKTQPVAVFELIGEVGEAASREDLLSRFRAALALFLGGRFQDAHAQFAKLATDYPDDGPTRFYLDAALRNALEPNPDGDGTLIHTTKPAPGEALWK